MKSRSPRADLDRTVARLEKTIRVTEREYQHSVALHRSMTRAFFRGVAYTVGVLVTVAIVVPITLWSLRMVNWPPIIAGIVEQVTLQLQRANLQGAPGADGQ